MGASLSHAPAQSGYEQGYGRTQQNYSTFGARGHDGWRGADDPVGLQRFTRRGWVGLDGRLDGQSEAIACIVGEDAFDPNAVRHALRSGEPVLRPSFDRQGRTIILVYGPDARPEGETCAPVLLTSLLAFGDALHQSARRFGVGKFTARICTALVENGSLRRAATQCGVTHQTARSEIADAMQAMGVTSQCSLVRKMAADWLCDSLESERMIDLLRTTFRLSPRDARVASLRAMGHSRQETAERLGVSRWAVEDSSANVFLTLGVVKAPDLTRILVDLMLASAVADALCRPSIARADWLSQDRRAS